MSARETALRVLINCRTKGAWADASLLALSRRDNLNRQDAALCSRITYGVLQNQLLLDFYLSAYCKQELQALQSPLLDILRIGGYQILFMDRIPDSAAVTTSVDLAKKFKRTSAAGLVNAVLRRLSQEKENLPEIPRKNDAKYLTIQYSHPTWLIKRLLTLLGREETEVLLKLNNSQPMTAAQVNTCAFQSLDLRRRLQDRGLIVQSHEWLKDCILLARTGNMEALDLFRQGAFYIQDPAGRLVPIAAGIQPGERILDVCAAPGGKSFASAIYVNDQCEILACDLYERKLKRLREGANRLGLKSIETASADGQIFHPEWEKQFDVVLVDAPCSGLGIIRKKPDARYKKLEDLFTLPVIQGGILSNASRYVRPGGRMIYSTCTILPDENEQVIDAFLGEHPNFVREAFTLPAPIGSTDGQITLWPQRHNTDGFYICRMVRKA